MAEARELALAGDARVADATLRERPLDIIADGLNGARADSAATEALEVLREVLSTLRADLERRGPLH